MTTENNGNAGAPDQAQKKDPPIQTIRHKGAFIKLWQQESENGPFVTATMGRTYTDKVTGEFGEGYSLSENDLGKIDLIMPEARREMAAWHDYYRQQEQQNTQAPQNAQVQQVTEQALPVGEQPHTPLSQAPNPQSDMTASRDAALAKAAPDQTGQGQAVSHERSAGMER